MLASALGFCQLEPPCLGAAPYLLVPQLEDSRILPQVMGSDHCPVELLSRLLEATCRELPEPKPRKKRAGE